MVHISSLHHTNLIDSGLLLRCPAGYFFCTERLRCISGYGLQLKAGQAYNVIRGFQVTRASPMFTLPDCISPGTYTYPDYRFYYVCQSSPTSGIVSTPKLYQCPPGLFYNELYRSCSKSSAFSARDVSNYSNLNIV